MDYKERIKELRDTLNAHSYRYYVCLLYTSDAADEL